MPKGFPKRGDDQLLEGGGAGGAGIRNTKWSSMPSFKSNASTVDDLKKIVSDTSKLKGAAKAAKEEAIDRAITRTGVRAAGAGAGAAALKSIGSAGATDTGKSEIELDGAADKNYDLPGGFSGKGMKKGGNVASSASKRGDGIAQRGKTKGRIV
jgi:hypothetical protein